MYNASCYSGLNAASTFASESNSTDMDFLETSATLEEDSIINTEYIIQEDYNEENNVEISESNDENSEEYALDTADLTPKDYNEETGELLVTNPEVTEDDEILSSLGDIPSDLYEVEDDEDEELELENEELKNEDEFAIKAILPVASPTTYSASVLNTTEDTIENSISMSIQVMYDYGYWDDVVKGVRISVFDVYDKDIEDDFLSANDEQKVIEANVTISCEYVSSNMNMSNGTDTTIIPSWKPATPEITGLGDDTYTIDEIWTINEVEQNGTVEEVREAVVTALLDDLATATVVYSYTIDENTTYTITINYTSVARPVLTIKSAAGAYLYTPSETLMLLIKLMKLLIKQQV